MIRPIPDHAPGQLGHRSGRQWATSADQEIRQLRAYVMLSRDFKKIDGFKVGEKPRVVATFENHGQTPAYEATWESGINFLPYPLPGDFTYPECTRILEQEDANKWSSFGKSSDIEKTAKNPITDADMQIYRGVLFSWPVLLQGYFPKSASNGFLHTVPPGQRNSGNLQAQ